MDGKCFNSLKLIFLMGEVWLLDVTVPLVASFLKVEEDLQGSSQIKEETDGTELKQEPMEIEEKKPEMKAEVKEEEESGTNGTTSQSTSPSQPRKKSTWMKTEFPPVPCFHWHCLPCSQLLLGDLFCTCVPSTWSSGRSILCNLILKVGFL